MTIAGCPCWITPSHPLSIPSSSLPPSPSLHCPSPSLYPPPFLTPTLLPHHPLSPFLPPSILPPSHPAQCSCPWSKYPMHSNMFSLLGTHHCHGCTQVSYYRCHHMSKVAVSNHQQCINIFACMVCNTKSRMHRIVTSSRSQTTPPHQ